ncbi:MAG: HEPN domain-containing protein [Thermodesulfovibrionia bacterium]
MKYATKNWIDTANYDFKTAEAMLKSKRYIYVVFMCHLSIEKMIKAIISTERKGLPPKSHSLLYLSKKASIQFIEDIQEFIEQLDNVSIITRYPEDLRRMSKEFNKSRAEEVFKKTRRTLRWLRQEKRLKV